MEGGRREGGKEGGRKGGRREGGRGAEEGRSQGGREGGALRGTFFSRGSRSGSKIFTFFLSVFGVFICNGARGSWRHVTQHVGL